MQRWHLHLKRTDSHDLVLQAGGEPANLATHAVVYRRRSCAGWFSSRSECIRSPRLLRSDTTAHQAVDVAAGGHHSLVALADGRGCLAFGSNKWWQLALRDSNMFHEPELVRPVSVSFVSR